MRMTSALEIASSERVSAFINSIVEHKKANGLTFRSLAEECEMSTNGLYDVIKRNKNMSLDTALKISMALGVKI